MKEIFVTDGKSVCLGFFSPPKNPLGYFAVCNSPHTNSGQNEGKMKLTFYLLKFSRGNCNLCSEDVWFKKTNFQLEKNLQLVKIWEKQIETHSESFNINKKI